MIQQRFSQTQAQGKSMRPYHEMDLSVRQGGEMKVELRYGGAMPDLIGKYPADVQLKARRWFLWPSAYERKLWRATKGLPFWARETVRQHILQERAERLVARKARLAERRSAKAKRRVAQMEAIRKATALLVRKPPPRPVARAVTERPVAAPTLTSRYAASALGPVSPRALSLTEQLGAKHGASQATPPSPIRAVVRDR